MLFRRSLAFVSLVSLPACDLMLSAGDDHLPPDAPAGMYVTETGRASATLELLAPMDDDGDRIAEYEVRLTADPDGVGGERVVTPVPAMPGRAQSMELPHLRPGNPVYVSAVAIDRAGNRSERAVFGPIDTDFAYSGAILPPRAADGDNAYGYRFAHGQFDAGAGEDLVVAAPFKQVGALAGAGAVYLHAGGPSGVAQAPSLVVEGNEALGQLGNAIASLDWNGDGRDDLAIAAPFAAGRRGVVYIFDSATLRAAVDSAGSVARSLSAADADVRITAGAGWLEGAALGFSLTRLDFDGDGRDDLALAVPGAGSDTGGVIIVFGGTASGDIALEDAAASGARAYRFAIAGNLGDFWGASLASLGRTGGETDRRDDLALAGFATSSIHVVRGRGQPAAAGLHDLSFEWSRDLVVESDEPAGTASFGSHLGSIDRGDHRDLVAASHRHGGGAGAVFLIDGRATGVHSLRAVTTLAIIGEPGTRFASAFANTAGEPAPDVDGDGSEDLAVVGGLDPIALHVFYGDELPAAGSLAASSAAYILPGPPEMTGADSLIGSSPITIEWAGDLDADGLDDLAWADWANNNRDGTFELLR